MLSTHGQQVRETRQPVCRRKVCVGVKMVPLPTSSEDTNRQFVTYFSAKIIRRFLNMPTVRILHSALKRRIRSFYVNSLILFAFKQ